MNYILWLIIAVLLALLISGRCAAGSVRIPPEFWSWMFTTPAALAEITLAAVLIFSMPKKR